MCDDQPFTFTDLLQIKNIIEIASSRGAFRADELSLVGTTYDRLSHYIDDIVAQAEEHQNKGQDQVQGETND